MFFLTFILTFGYFLATFDRLVLGRAGLGYRMNHQKLMVPEISSGPRQEKRDNPHTRLTGLGCIEAKFCKNCQNFAEFWSNFTKLFCRINQNYQICAENCENLWFFRYKFGKFSAKMPACFIWHHPPVGVDSADKSGWGHILRSSLLVPEAALNGRSSQRTWHGHVR